MRVPVRLGVVGAALLASTACTQKPVELAFEQPLSSASYSTPAIGQKSIAFGTESGDVYYYGLDGTYRAKFNAHKDVVSAVGYDTDNDMFFFGSTSYVFYATSGLGKRAWDFPTTDRIKGDPLVTDGVVYFGSYDDKLYALGTRDKRKRWVFPPKPAPEPEPVAEEEEAPEGVQPVAAGDTPDADAAEAAEGEVAEAAPAEPKPEPIVAGDFAYSKPFLADGVVYVGNLDGHLYAIDAADGSLRWRYKTGDGVTSSPWVEDGVVYFGSNDKNVYAVNAADQKVLWKKETGGWVNASPVVRDGVVYVGSDDGKLYALDAKTGAEKWAYDTGGEIKSRPCFVDDLIFVTTGARKGGLWAVDTNTGELFWSYAIDGKIESDPVARDRTVYVTTGDRRFLGFKVNQKKGG